MGNNKEDMNICDFCGEEFDHAPNTELARLDICVCESCEEIVKLQMDLNGEDEEDEEDEYIDGYIHDTRWNNIDMNPDY
jgi:hypothetical protein